MNKKELYAKFYSLYTPRRDKLILWYLKRLRKTNPERHRRLAEAYWNTRLANRPFMVAKPVYAERETPETRAAYLRLVDRVYKK